MKSWYKERPLGSQLQVQIGPSETDSGNQRDMRVGVLALQGTFVEHIDLLRQLSVDAPPIRLPNDLDTLHGLVIPGGESTTMLRLMRSFGLLEPLRRMAQRGLPVWGTCAGMILLAKSVSNYEMETLGLMDVKVRRNAFGSQIDSFEADLKVPRAGEEPFHAVFIRAPVIEEAAADVEILAHLPDGTMVAARQGLLLACAFHPEFTHDLRFHRYFLSIVGHRLSQGAKEKALRGDELVS